MAKVNLSDALRGSYQVLFDACLGRPARAGEVERILKRLTDSRARYAGVGDQVGAPWWLVAVIHNMESSLRFDRHLHNGDPLTARTVQVPAGRPRNGTPPFSWEDSAVDALRLRNIHQWTDWSVPGTLYQLEGYNGWGYRLYHAHVLTPYLWSFSNHYTSGKYVRDGKWSDTAVSDQCGAAALLRLAERGDIVLGREFAPAASLAPAPAGVPLLRYSTKQIAHADTLQAFLNQFPDIYLKVDGKPGQKTSDAFKTLTGNYLSGDPRATV